MKEQFLLELKKLFNLQNKDIEISSLKEQLESIPISIEKLNQQIQQLQQSVEINKSDLKQIQLQLKQKEGDIRSIEEKINKHNSELNSVKTNEQYKALLNEIQSLKLEKDKIETEILELLSKQDDANNKIKIFDKELNEKKSGIEKQIVELKTQQQVIEQQILQKESERQTLSNDINPKYLEIYEHVRKNRDGIALAIVKDKACGVCNMRLTQQEINEVSKYEEFILCESCSRILYIQEDLEK